MPLRRRRAQHARPAIAPYQRAQLQLHVPLRGAALGEIFGASAREIDDAFTRTTPTELTQRLALLADVARLIRSRLGMSGESWRVELHRPRHAFDERSVAMILQAGSIMDARAALRDVAGLSPRTQ